MRVGTRLCGGILVSFSFTTLFSFLTVSIPTATCADDISNRVVKLKVCLEDGLIHDFEKNVELNDSTRNSLILNRSRLVDISGLTGLPLTDLYLDCNPLANIMPLKGMRLRCLTLRHTTVTDLTPLAGMPLEELRLDGCPVRDISPLKGLPINRLSLLGTPVVDITALSNVPLRELRLGTNVSNVLPLTNSRITDLYFCPQVVTAGVEVIRQMDSIRYVNDWESWYFWREYDDGHLLCAFNKDPFGMSRSEWYHDPEKRHPPASPLILLPDGPLRDKSLVPDRNWRFEQTDKTNAEFEVAFRFRLDEEAIPETTTFLRRGLDSEERLRWHSRRVFLEGIRADGKDSGFSRDIDILAFLHQGINVFFNYRFCSKDKCDSVQEDFIIPYHVNATGTVNRVSYDVRWKKAGTQ